MYRGYNKGFKVKKYRSKNTVDRGSLDAGGGSAVALQIVRIVTAALLIAVVVGAVAVGMHMYGSENSFENSQVAAEGDNSRLLRVVNKSNPLEEDYVPDLKEYRGYSVCTAAVPDLEKMLEAAKKDGVDISVDFAYVSYEQQDELYNTAYNRLIKEKNLTSVTAQAQTQVVTPQAGRSEYQTGLLVRFKTGEKGKFKNTAASLWLSRNSTDYGFVLRYTEEKKSRTSMNADYTAYRYVGKDNARVMLSLDMCLDEYSAYIKSR